MWEKIEYEGSLFAIIIKSSYSENGINFFTENQLSQQLAFMKHPKGKEIEPHLHNRVKREVDYTQETLFIKSGILRVDFYNNKKQYLQSYKLRAGDVILLVQGGHGFEVLEDLEMFEVKQGPFAGDNDKTRFTANLSKNEIILK